MLSYEQIKELIRLVTENRLQGLEVEKSGFRLKITGFGGLSGSGSVAGGAPARDLAAAPGAAGGSLEPSALPPPAAAEPAAPAAAAPATGLHVVTSPIVGTFYTATSPDAEPFVRVGDRIRKGQVLCIVEAMKLMNEIESDVDGVLAEVHPKNGQPVEFGEPLFGVRSDGA